MRKEDGKVGDRPRILWKCRKSDITRDQQLPGMRLRARTTPWMLHFVLQMDTARLKTKKKPVVNAVVLRKPCAEEATERWPQRRMIGWLVVGSMGSKASNLGAPYQ